MACFGGVSSAALTVELNITEEVLRPMIANGIQCECECGKWNRPA